MDEESLNYVRRFGAELEVNAFDMRSRPIYYEKDILPEGIFYIANLLEKTTNEKILIRKWGNDHNNGSWIIKPDSSCGLEICTPVLKGWQGLMEICKVVDALAADEKITSDHRCSFHVHIDVSDLTDDDIANVIAWWIKCEPVFMDAMPPKRKINQYCQYIGLNDMFLSNSDLLPANTVLNKLGKCKYYSINTFHYFNKKRKSMEFRIMDSEACLNSWISKNWIRLIVHFVEKAVKIRPTNYNWIDPIEVFNLLELNSNNLSLGLEQVRKWFLGRLLTKGRNTGLTGILSDDARRVAIHQVDELIEKYYKEDILSKHTTADVYCDKFRI